MSIKIGDKVSIIDTDIIGKVIDFSIEKNAIKLDSRPDEWFPKNKVQTIETLISGGGKNVSFNSVPTPILTFNAVPDGSGLTGLYTEFLKFTNQRFKGIDGKTYKIDCSVNNVNRAVVIQYIEVKPDDVKK